MHFKNSCRQGGVQFSYEIILGGYSFHTPHFPKPTSGVVSYNVRDASNNVFVPRPRIEAAKRAFSYRGSSHVEWPRK